MKFLEAPILFSGMDFQEIGIYAKECFRDEPPPCACGCPFGLDVRDLVAKARKGRYGSAARAYSDAVLFPGIVSALCLSPCRNVCVREVTPGGGGAVDLRKIEQDLIAKAGRRAAVRYAIPPKTEKIAVIGAGLSGLACAWRLGSKGYRVTLYEASDRAGGSVRGSALSDDVIDADIDSLMGSINYDLRLGEHISDIAPLLAENSAVYAATGKRGADFGLLDGWDSRTLASATPGVFIGGSATLHSADPNVADVIENGLRAASAIEEFLKTGRNEGNGPLFNRPRINEKFYSLGYDFDAERPAESADGCAAEAFRCPGCNCSKCIDACTMIRHFRQNPKRIAADLGVTLLPVDEKIKHVASRMLNSCNLCGLCAAVCPVGVDTCAAMRESRNILKGNGHLPAAYHDFWMADMEFSMSEEAYLLTASDRAPARLLFFPGCQLTASLPDVVESAFAHIRRAEPGAAMLLSCCGVPADWAGEKAALAKAVAKIRAGWESLGRPMFLYACGACRKTFEKYLPEAKGILVYEWLAGQKNRPESGSEKYRNRRACVYDPCNCREDANGRSAVRQLAREAGYKIAEIASGGEKAACCGFGGQIYSANPGLVEKILLERTSASELPYITYCANCRDLFLSKEKESRHIL
ncbi:MAG: FAD-dependent oxidoreductase, partial [Acidobacteriota bacterium]|nr:FAD-dependent oxidoreductase [Acidobacteriota bacterium]